MLPFLERSYGNPSSAYGLAQEARRAVDDARDLVAELLGCRNTEIVFTSGGTESDNLAIKGVAEARRERGGHIVTTAVEHHAVLHTCQFLEKYLGFEITVVPVDAFGQVDPARIADAFRPDTLLVS